MCECEALSAGSMRNCTLSALPECTARSKHNTTHRHFPRTGASPRSNNWVIRNTGKYSDPSSWIRPPPSRRPRANDRVRLGRSDEVLDRGPRLRRHRTLANQHQQRYDTGYVPAEPTPTGELSRRDPALDKREKISQVV